MQIFEKLFNKQNNNTIVNKELMSNFKSDNSQIYPQKVFSNTMVKENNNITKTSIEEIKKPVKYTIPSLEILENSKMKENLINLPKESGIIIPIGKNELNEVQYYDIGGTVMSGKTNFINNIICSIIMSYSPENVRIAICDSKGLEYNCYDGIPNLLMPVIKKAHSFELLIDYLMREIKKRYELFDKYGVKKILDYNKIKEYENIPYYVVFIDDYTLFANEIDLNDCIEYITKNGWIVGIHLIVVANHPTINRLSTLSLLNFPSRMSFRVTSNKDSRMILDASGAEKLAGIGNALLKTPLKENIEKISIDLINDEDILSIVNNLRENNSTFYINSLDDNYEEPLYDEIVAFAIQIGKISSSLIQRRFRLGYNRAARVIDLLEERGVIGPPNGAKPREVLIKNI